MPLNIGVVLTDAIAVLSEESRYLYGRAFPRVIGFGLVRHSDDYDFWIGNVGERLAESSHCSERHGIVDLSGSRDELCVRRVDLRKEPWIDGDAVPADSNTRSQDVHARVGICNLDGLSRINAKGLGNHGKFIRKCNIHIPVGVLHDFDEFCRHIIREEDFALYKGSVDLLRSLTGLEGNRTNYTVVFHDFFKDVARENPFWAMGQANVHIYL